MVCIPVYCIAFLGTHPQPDRLLLPQWQQAEARGYIHGRSALRTGSNSALYYATGHSRGLHERADPPETESSDIRVTEWDAGRHKSFRCAGVASPDSVFREPLPGEAITLPNPSATTGEYLLDREIIHRVAELRTFLEDIEVSRGKRSQLREIERGLNSGEYEIRQVTKEEADRLTAAANAGPDVESQDTVDDTGMPETPMEINEITLEPIKEHMYEENMLEEVLGKAFSVYRKNRDQASIQRLEVIASEIAPIADKVRKERAEEIIVRLVNCYVDGSENIDDVLYKLHKQKQLNKYLMQRFDELIKLASKKFRLSDEHPALSEQFLRTLKDRVAAEVLTSARGTRKWVRILAECFRYDNCVDYERVLKENLRKIEDIEDFRDWLLDGIEYCRDKGRMEERIEAMETIESIVVGLHPVWTPQDNYIETEDRPYDHPIIYEDDDVAR
ncbi:hypothetical protein, conserved [Babesia bigemina]|uniref:Uncharacterized protein n=1 Tax=Babesia bigemina TaxID=5866 RepID=A0A061D9J9_BABBI|nr:hypothetical protein, conserved [Babesia bigemina]CDR96662.1 hypothetical protein, conserved [Babesia bigemina]|eukprot:XP_012768848.1 hypothetical protein, conserved [Babesia bigemina]